MPIIIKYLGFIRRVIRWAIIWVGDDGNSVRLCAFTGRYACRLTQGSEFVYTNMYTFRKVPCGSTSAAPTRTGEVFRARFARRIRGYLSGQASYPLARCLARTGSFAAATGARGARVRWALITWHLARFQLEPANVPRSNGDQAPADANERSDCDEFGFVSSNQVACFARRTREDPVWPFVDGPGMRHTALLGRLSLRI